MPYCRCGSEFSEARARLGFDCCLECGGNEAAAEAARHACMIDRPDKPQIRLHLSGNRSDDGAADAAGTGPIRKNRPMIRSSHDSSLEGDGFEPSVSREIGFDFEASILSVTRTAQSGPLVDG